MKFTYTEKIKRKVDISNKEAAKIALDYIKEEFNLESDMWIEDGKLMHEVEYITSHKWTSNEIIREATKEDKIMLKAVELIKKRII